MADIRINALATTAASTASDDFVAVDGSANGTRKLNAFSPTFGGNLTVSGGTIGTAASTNLTLAGGSTGASLVLGQGTNGSAQLVSKGTGRIILQGQNPTTIAQGNESFVFSGLNQGPGNVQLALGMNETGGFFPWLQSYRVGGSAGSYLVLQPAAGNLLIGTTTDRSNRLHLAAAGPSYIGMGQMTSTYAGIVFGDVTLADSASGFNIAGNAANSNLVFNVNTGGSMNWRVGNANAFTLSSASNLLIGTTTDSANGKLQLATHTTSAGGIGFGTDTSLYRADAGALAINYTGTGSGLRFYESSVYKSAVGVYDGALYLDTYTAKSVVVRTNSTTALTLDSSQRTIANGAFWSSSTGNTSTNGFNNATSIANNLISLYGSTGSANIQIAGRVTTFDGGSGYYGLNLQAPTSAYPDFSGTVNWTNALTLTSQNATFAGNVAIQSGKALRLYNPANSAFASIEMDSNNVVNVNYTTAFGVTIRTQGGSASTPASASAAGVAGTIQWDANYIYVCTAVNTWKRVAIATWP